MSSVATSRGQNWPLTVARMVNSTVCIIALTVVIGGFFGIVDVHVNADLINNTLSTWFPAWVAIVLGIAFIVGSIVWFLQHEGGKTEHPLYWFESNRVWKFSVFVVVLAILLFGGSWLDANANSRLGTPRGYVRVIDDGRVLSAGMVVAHDPARVTSVIVALVQRSDTEVRIRKQDRYAVQVNVSASVVLDDNMALRALLAKASTKVLGFGSEAPGRIKAQNRFFAARLHKVLGQSVSQLLAEIDAGKLQGGRDILLNRLGAIVDGNRKNYPSWAKEIIISNVIIKKVHIQR